MNPKNKQKPQISAKSWPKWGMVDFELRTTHRERAVGKGRVGVNPYRLLIGVWSWGSTRSEAKGLGGFQFLCHSLTCIKLI